MIPRIRETATVVMVISPKVRLRPPIPGMRIEETTKRLLLSLRSTPWIILSPETAIKP